MPSANANNQTSVPTKTGSKGSTPFKPASNVATVRKPSAGLKAVTTSTSIAPSVSVSSSAGGGNAAPSVASTAYPSDEENVRPAQTPSQVQGPEQGQAPLSPRPLSPQLKDVRAYEHERQRTKRAGERAARRATKAGVGAKGLVVGADAGVWGRKTRGNREREEEVDGEYVVGGIVPGFGFPSVLALASNDGAGDVVPSPVATAPTVDVTLEELVVPSRPKPKVHGLSVKGSTTGLDDDEEFEWVPALRAVIALDEVEVGRRDMEVDEPWECVDEEGVGGGVAEVGLTTSKGRQKERELSYAEVLSGMHVE